ncbi:periplasmic heavy metal sensor [Desulfobacterales bacterium HSG17]|nr:periplasmic heavy metal sensor [Desulfobacterales bacterium HSG17]
MKKQKWTLMVIGLSLFVAVGFSSISFAGRGYGMMNGQNSGNNRGSWGMNNMYGNLSDAQITELQKEQQAFFQATEKLRSNLYQKNLALAAEMAKENPDVKMAKSIQSEISDLSAQMAQEQLAHRIELQKRFPELASQASGMGFGRKGNRGTNGGGRGMRNNACPGCAY